MNLLEFETLPMAVHDTGKMEPITCGGPPAGRLLLTAITNSDTAGQDDWKLLWHHPEAVKATRESPR